MSQSLTIGLALPVCSMSANTSDRLIRGCTLELVSVFWFALEPVPLYTTGVVGTAGATSKPLTPFCLIWQTRHKQPAVCGSSIVVVPAMLWWRFQYKNHSSRHGLDGIWTCIIDSVLETFQHELGMTLASGFIVFELQYTCNWPTRAQSTEPRAQSQEPRAQSTEHRAQSIDHWSLTTERYTYFIYLLEQRKIVPRIRYVIGNLCLLCLPAQ